MCRVPVAVYSPKLTRRSSLAGERRHARQSEGHLFTMSPLIVRRVPLECPVKVLLFTFTPGLVSECSVTRHFSDRSYRQPVDGWPVERTASGIRGPISRYLNQLAGREQHETGQQQTTKSVTERVGLVYRRSTGRRRRPARRLNGVLSRSTGPGSHDAPETAHYGAALPVSGRNEVCRGAKSA